MNRTLRERRDSVGKRHDAALERDPSRATNWFETELRAVVEELERICEAADSSGSDPVEVAMTFRWLGDALFDLGRGEDKGLLGRAAQAYDRSEALLEEEEAPVEQAKLDCNYANTLRCLSGGEDVGLLEAAELRYERSLAGFDAKQLRPQVAAVEEMLRTVRIQLGLAREGSRMAKGLAEMKQLAEALDGADGVERERIERELSRIKSTLGTDRIQDKLAEALATAGALTKKHSEKLPQGPDLMAKLETQTAQFREQVSRMQSGTATTNAEREAENAALSMMVVMLKQRLASEEQSGRVSKDRADQIRRNILRRAEEVLAIQGDDLFTLQKRAAMAREVALAAAELAMSPSWKSASGEGTAINAGWQTERPKRASRGARVLRMLDGLRSRLLAEKTVAMVADGEAQAGTDLLMRIITTETQIREYVGDDARLASTDAEVWRLAADAQAYSARHHLMLTRPIFQTPRKEVDAHSVFFSGGDVLRSIANLLLRRGEVVPLIETEIGDYAENRWSQLFSASIGVFDLGMTTRGNLAQVCYEIGIALAIGKPVIVLARVAQTLPFDVGLKPYVISSGAEADADAVLEAICDTLAQPLWGGAEAGLDHVAAEGLRWLKDEYRERLSEGSGMIALRSAEAQMQDVTALGRALQQLLGMLGAGAPLIAFPAWPPAYPSSANKPRCFHVMPFRPDWASPTRDLARTVCKKRGWDYVRGDESEEQRIIRAIWTEICSASAVVVDITDQNPNVALELGMTHAIGRPVRILAQGDVEKHMFPSVRKLQVHRYDGRPAYGGFVEAIGGLLDSAANQQHLLALR